MNKIFKYSLGILTTCICLLNLCSADLIAEIQRTSRSQITTETAITFTGDRCVMKTSGTMTYNTGGGAVTMNHDYQYCFASGDTVIFSGSTRMNWGLLVDYRNSGNDCPTCPTCDDPYTSLQCQTEYNLIPIESVTANYCHVNFGLIDPMDCPVGDGTGATQWSALYINQQQYAGNDNINISIPNDISWSLDYNDDDTDIDIEGYNADQEYIENIIAQEKMTPTNEDFEYMIQSLSGFIPYLFIGLLIFFMVRIFNKIWK